MPQETEEDSGRGAFAELRGLLLGPEQEEIRQLKEGLSSARSAEEMSRALAHAVRLASQRDLQFRSALLPVVEQSIRVSVRQNPRILGEALWPIIGDAVRKAVASAVRQLAESLQQGIEQSFTARGLVWRVEAFRSGRPYGEIALVHSLLYRVERVFLIHRESGLLLVEHTAESSNPNDGDLLSAMLTAIQDFVKDSFGGPAGNALETIEAGEFVIWVQQGPQAILAALIRGTPPRALKQRFDEIIQSIAEAHAHDLENFKGDVAPFQACEPELAGCFVGQGDKAHRRVFWPIWLIGCLLLLLVAGLGYRLQSQARRWSDFVSLVSRQPGIVVTASGKDNGNYFVTGLRDPLAPDPERLLRGAGYKPADVRFDWRPYISYQQPFAGIRDFAEARNRVVTHRVYFPADADQLPSDQIGNLEEAAQQIRELLSTAKLTGQNVALEIVGHTDSSGSEQRNAKLSQARALNVAAALISLGVPAERLSTSAVGNQEPAVATEDLSGRAFNRCVSVRVRISQP